MAQVQLAETYHTATGLKVRRLQPAIGAEISGVDLSADLTPAVVQDLRDAVLAHGVIFFRNQPMDYARHVALGGYFGDLVRDGADLSRPEITPVRSAAGARKGTSWHSDGVFSPAPPSFSILRAIEVRPFGGDTWFSSAVAAYEGLSDEMKARIADLRYTAELGQTLRRVGERSLNFGQEEKWRALERKYPMVEQPVVRAHPETGAAVLYVNEGFSLGVVGMDEAEGRELLRALNDEFKRPEYQVGWTWENDSVAMWDNRAVQHYGVGNPQYDRYLERVTVTGTPAVSLRDWNRTRAAAPA